MKPGQKPGKGEAGSAERGAGRGFVVLFLLLSSLYLLLTGGHFFSIDEIHYYRTARSLLSSGELSIDCIKDTVRGVGGECYSRKGVGLSLFSLPLQVAGEMLQAYLPESWQAVFSGVRLGPGGEWGGDIGIFTAVLFNAPVTALVCALLFLCGLELGYSLRASLVLALLLGLCTILPVYAKTLFSQPLMALLYLLTFYLLLRNKRRRRHRLLLLAGACHGLAVLTRFDSVILFPLFFLYALHSLGQPLAIGGLRRAGRGLAAFSLPALLGVMAYLLVNRIRFGSFFVFGDPGYTALDTPLLVGLYGNLFSPGRSLFLYSPPLILSLVYWMGFQRRFRAEALLLGGVFLLSLLVFSGIVNWHGGWGWGNRYLLPVVPLLLLPLGMELDDAMQRPSLPALAALVGIALAGLFLLVLGATPYVSSIYWEWTRAGLDPHQSFLFAPEISPPVAHFRAVIEGRYIDYWLFFVYQSYGMKTVLLFMLAPVTVMALAARAIYRLYRESALSPGV